MLTEICAPTALLTRSPWQPHSWCLSNIFIGSLSKHLRMCKVWGRRTNPWSPGTESHVVLLREVTVLHCSQAVLGTTFWSGLFLSPLTVVCHVTFINTFYFLNKKNSWKWNLSSSFCIPSCAVPDFHPFSIKGADQWRWMNRKMVTAGNLANTYIPRG